MSMNLTPYRRLNKLHDLSPCLNGKTSGHDLELIKPTASVSPTLKEIVVIAHIVIVEVSAFIYKYLTHFTIQHINSVRINYLLSHSYRVFWFCDGKGMMPWTTEKS